MSEELVVFHPSRDNDPEGKSLRGAIAAQFALETALARRVVLGYATMLATLVELVLYVRPPAARFPRALGLFVWLVCALGWAGAALSARRWRRRRERMAKALASRPT